MISVRQWIISALGLLTIVTFSTYHLVQVQVPRSMDRSEWVRFVTTQIPGVENMRASTSLWSLLMGIQGVQLVFGIPFLHVTQISMGFLLHPVMVFMSCAVLELLVMYGFLLIQTHTVHTMPEEAQRAMPMVNERHAKRIWFAFSMLMSSLPLYMGVVTVHVGIVRRYEFVLLAVVVSTLSVSKNVVLGALLRAGGNALACAVLGLLVFVSPILFTLVTVYMSSLAKADGPPTAEDALELDEVRSLAGTCTSEPSAFEQYDAYLPEQAEDEMLAERIDEILNPEPEDSEPSPSAGVRDADAVSETLAERMQDSEPSPSAGVRDADAVSEILAERMQDSEPSPSAGVRDADAVSETQEQARADAGSDGRHVRS